MSACPVLLYSTASSALDLALIVLRLVVECIGLEALELFWGVQACLMLSVVVLERSDGDAIDHGLDMKACPDTAECLSECLHGSSDVLISRVWQESVNAAHHVLLIHCMTWGRCVDHSGQWGQGISTNL